MRRAWVLLGLVGVAGCLPLTEERSTLVGGNPFNQPTRLSPITQVNYSPASKEISVRVIQTGQRLVQANPQLPFRPIFATIGSPRLELFHMDTPIEPVADASARTSDPISRPVIYITEGMVKRCPTDLELSAVLSYEMGRIQSEREANLKPEIRNPEKKPPIQVPIGNAGEGRYGPDLTAMAELGKFEKQYPKSRRPLPPPDPRKVAVQILDKANVPPTALETIEPILQEAEHNAALERHLKGGQLPTWTPE